MSLKEAIEQSLISVVRDLHPQRAAQVLDFARWLQTQPAPTEDDDWLNDSEEQLQAEDALWDAMYERHRDQFAALAAETLAEIAAGTTQPMFDADGELITDELIHHPQLSESV